MFSHEPPHYDCFICRLVDRQPEALLADSELVCLGESTSAFLGIWHWPAIPVDAIVVPNQHIENIYDLPSALAADLQRTARAMALALKAVYHCDGITVRQNNEPAGGQDVWHYHMHIIPRFTGDGYPKVEKISLPEQQRRAEARRMREYLQAAGADLFREETRIPVTRGEKR